MDQALRLLRTIGVAPTLPGTDTSIASDVRVLHRIDIDSAAVGVLRPRVGPCHVTAIERGGVVGAPRAVIARAVMIDELHPADLEVVVPHRAERVYERGRGVLVHDYSAHVSVAVEAVEAGSDHPKIPERDGTAVVPRITGHPPSQPWRDA